MAENQWYWVSAGVQQGPVADDEFHRLVAGGQIGRSTLVWNARMSDWQQAGDVPGLLPPPLPPLPGGAPPAGAHGPFKEHLGVWGLFGRGLLYYLGILFVIPAPWAANALYHWAVSKIEVPGRPRLAFTGTAEDIWYVWMGLAACSYLTLVPFLALPIFLLQAFLGWLVLRWAVANLSSEGQRLPLRFTGSGWAYVGWALLTIISIFSIIGWAWVATAFGRWVCRHIAGTRRTISFNASGWQVLWRLMVWALSCLVIVPIPWSTRWLVGWHIRQFSVGNLAISASSRQGPSTPEATFATVAAPPLR